jgi:hypothetical protein
MLYNPQFDVDSVFDILRTIPEPSSDAGASPEQLEAMRSQPPHG